MSRFTASARHFILTALLFAAGGLMAQDNIFMQIPGIKGSSTNSTHPGWVDVVALSNCFSKPSAGAAAACDFNLTKNIDISSTFVYSNLLNGKATGAAKVLVDVCINTGGPSLFCYYKLELSNVRFTSVSSSTSGGSGPINESWSMAFDAIKWTYLVPPTGTTTTTACWNFALNSAACP